MGGAIGAAASRDIDADVLKARHGRRTDVLAANWQASKSVMTARASQLAARTSDPASHDERGHLGRGSSASCVQPGLTCCGAMVTRRGEEVRVSSRSVRCSRLGRVGAQRPAQGGDHLG